MVEGARLEYECAGQTAPRVRIPPSPQLVKHLCFTCEERSDVNFFTSRWDSKGAAMYTRQCVRASQGRSNVNCISHCEYS